jgi:hypothetical protein
MLEQAFLSFQSYKVPYSETYEFTNIFTNHPRVPHNEHILHSLYVYKNAEILTCTELSKSCLPVYRREITFVKCRSLVWLVLIYEPSFKCLIPIGCSSVWYFLTFNLPNISIKSPLERQHVYRKSCLLFLVATELSI